MIDIILSALAENNITVYRINEEQTSSVELFFIKKKLDMRRSSDIHSYRVTIFNDFEKDNVKMRGSSTTYIHPGMSPAEVSQTLKDAYFAASFVCNRHYELISETDNNIPADVSSLAELSLEEAAIAMTNALYAADTFSDAWINSAEVFVYKTVSRILTSEGIDVSYTSYRTDGEFVTQCTSPADVEIYTGFSYDSLACDELTKKAKASLKTVTDRAKADAAPAAGTYDIILSDKNVAEILSYYTDRSNASYIYPGYSNFSLGDNVQGSDITGETLKLSLSNEAPYSEDGIVMTNRELINNGTLKLIHGATRFCRYIGVEPTGNFSKIICSNGTVSFEDMKKQPYLHIVNFSDFQMDSFSGHFGGEIRLAYLFDGKDIKLVTGGSINGSITEAQKNFVFTTDRYSDRSYEGPLAVRINNVNVAGI